MTKPRTDAEVRAPAVGEGPAIAGLWRELWDAHEDWGGYVGAKDAETYARVAERIDESSALRRGRPALGRHLHLIATHRGVVSGQVEGWIDRFGIHPNTPTTCEVRSLIVTRETRASGLGRALLEGLARTAREIAGGPVALAAEVLEPNPAHAFYARTGYVPVAWSVRRSTEGATWPKHARFAGPKDALPAALLDSALLTRRRVLGDPRFDPPKAIDATTLDAVSTYLSRPPGELPAEIVATDAQGYIRATATLVVMHLDPPFVSAARAALCRVSVDPAIAPTPFVETLIELGAHVARRHGARTIEVTDLGPPGTSLHRAALESGGDAKPWSRIVVRSVP